MSHHDKALNKLAELLRKKPLTALQISQVTGCCKPTAYARLLALKRRGDRLVEIRQSSGRPGPSAVAYSIR